MVDQEKKDGFLNLTIIGDDSCGKSCLSRKFCKNTFQKAHKNRLANKYRAKWIYCNERRILLQITESPAWVKFRLFDRARSTLYRETHGFIIVFDLTNRESFERLYDRIIQIDEKPFIIIGTKSDLKSQRQVTFDEAREFAKNNRSCYIEVSNKTGYNVEKAFLFITGVIMNKITLAIIGKATCGKSNLLRRFIHKPFQYWYKDTEASKSVNAISIFEPISYNEKGINLQIWDTSGNKMWRNWNRAIYDKIQGFMIVFDLTQRRSFNSLSEWINEIYGFAKTFIIIGTKSDLLSQRQVTYDEAKEFADNNGSCYLEVSNLNCYNVENAFGLIVSEIMSRFN